MKIKKSNWKALLGLPSCYLTFAFSQDFVVYPQIKCLPHIFWASLPTILIYLFPKSCRVIFTFIYVLEISHLFRYRKP